MLYRYSRWDGTQEFQPFTPDDLMDRIAEEMLEHGDLRSVLRRLLQRGADFPGGRRMMGLQELLERLRGARDQRLQRYNLGSMLDDIQERLDRIIDTERRALERRLQEASNDGAQPGEQSDGTAPQRTDEAGSNDTSQPPPPSAPRDQAGQGAGSTDPAMRRLLQNIARQRLEQLSGLPPDVGGRIKGLRDYDFMDPEAREQFEELLRMLQEQIMQNYFQGLQQGIQSLTPEALQQISQMVRDLNRLLEQRLRGEEPDFQQFMEQWSDFFPEGIESLDQLIEHLQRQMAQMESLLNSMTPEMRRQLQEMMDALLQDHRLQWDLMQLAANMERLNPRHGGANDFPFFGDEPLTLQEALRLMGDMNSMAELEQELIQAARSNDASNLDTDEIGRLLGEEARQMAEQLQQLTKMLEEAGLIRRRGNDWELTPRAIRTIGERALQDIFGKLKNSAFGDHTLERGGVGVERMDETKPYAFGDQFLIDSQRSVMNAVLRERGGTPVRIRPDDFEVYRTQLLTQCSTVIMLDMSYSMMRGGRFQAGRKVALALDTLIRSKFPKDNLYVVAFSYFVLTLKPEMLLDSYWVEYGGGTNFQEALRQARRLLARHKVGTKQIIFITDGEPTTYSYWSGGEDGWRPGRRLPGVLEETLREVVRCTKDDITINTFILNHHPYPLEFMRLVAKVNRGRAFFTTPSRLGEYILLDYVNQKRKSVR